MFSSICALLNGWVNNRKAGDLRRHRAHYDVILMNLKLNKTHNSGNVLDMGNQFGANYDKITISKPQMPLISHSDYVIITVCDFS